MLLISLFNEAAFRRPPLPHPRISNAHPFKAASINILTSRRLVFKITLSPLRSPPPLARKLHCKILAISRVNFHTINFNTRIIRLRPDWRKAPGLGRIWHKRVAGRGRWEKPPELSRFSIAFRGNARENSFFRRILATSRIPFHAALFSGRVFPPFLSCRVFPLSYPAISSFSTIFSYLKTKAK